MLDFHSGPSINSYKRISNWINLEKDKAQEIKEAYYATISFVDD